MIHNDIVGYIGVFFISTNLLPQIYHIYTIKNADSISTVSITLGFISGCIMGTYGYLIDKIPIIISNFFITSFYIIILGMKYYYSYKREIIVQDVTYENIC
jgi:uncharacterized protein with PQ loop repeat